MKAIVVTGVSSGIGYAIAKEFIRCGYQVFGSVRQNKDARQLVQDLGSNFTPLLFDVTDADALQAAAEQVTQAVGHRGLAGLINNAGIATTGPLAEQPLAEIRWQFEVNVIAPIAVTRAFLPLLKDRSPDAQSGSRPGKIINISSVAGKIAFPFMGAYAGSKHALEAMSNSLRRELQLHNIDLIIVAPGAVNTPIWDRKSAQDMSAYAATEYARSLDRFQRFITRLGKSGYDSEKIGRFVREVFELRHPKTRYAIVPRAFSNWVLPQVLPSRWLDKLIGRDLDLLSKSQR